MVVNAVATALNITWVGVLIRQGRRRRSAAPADGLRRIREVIARNTGDAIETHDLCTRHAAPRSSNSTSSCPAA